MMKMTNNNLHGGMQALNFQSITSDDSVVESDCCGGHSIYEKEITSVKLACFGPGRPTYEQRQSR